MPRRSGVRGYPRPAAPPKDPRERRVQLNVLIPHWYREQLYDYCDEHGKTLHSVVIGAILMVVPPRKPPKLGDWPPEDYKWGYASTEQIDMEAEG